MRIGLTQHGQLLLQGKTNTYTVCKPDDILRYLQTEKSHGTAALKEGGGPRSLQ